MALVAGLAGCPDNSGVVPPIDQFFYPVSLAASPSGNWLYVTSADFDLRYNGGTVAPVDLACVRAAIADPSRTTCAGVPGGPALRCSADRDQAGARVCESRAFIRSAQVRRISPYAVDSAVAQYPTRTRLYVAVRGDGSITWFDLDDAGGLDCGAQGAGATCSDTHRAGADTSQSPIAARLAPDPSSLSLDPERGWIFVTHQSTDPTVDPNTNATQPRASLLRDPASTGGSGAPVLLSAIGNLSPGLSDGVLLPRATGSGARSTWVVTSRSVPFLSFFQAYPGSTALRDGQPFLYQSSSVTVTGLNTGADSRAIVLDPDPAKRRAYIVSRLPEALLTLSLDAANPTTAVVTDARPLPGGPSRLVVRTVGGRTQLLVVSFDARVVTVIDADEGRVLGEIFTGRGPHQAILDPSAGHPFLYLVDFLDAAVEVVDLRLPADPANPGTYLHRVLTLAPQLPE